VYALPQFGLLPDLPYNDANPTRKSRPSCRPLKNARKSLKSEK